MTLRKRRRKQPHKPLPFNGDHGPNTALAQHNTVIEEITNEDGKNPNRMARRRRVEVIKTLSFLSQRQIQAAQEIRDAYCKVQTLSSGGPLKEQVDASPKPDGVVAAQVDAMSRLAYCMGAVPAHQRYVVEGVCWHNGPLTSHGRRYEVARSDLEGALTCVANKMRY